MMAPKARVERATRGFSVRDFVSNTGTKGTR